MQEEEGKTKDYVEDEWGGSNGSGLLSREFDDVLQAGEPQSKAAGASVLRSVSRSLCAGLPRALARAGVLA